MIFPIALIILLIILELLIFLGIGLFYSTKFLMTSIMLIILPLSTFNIKNFKKN